MTRIVLPLAVLTATFALALPARAVTLTRTFVSAAGSDSNPCTITQPCATFAHAYSVTAASGIIAALDPGKYGPVTITGPITINGNGWAAITAPAADDGIIINAGASDIVELTGLEIDGAGAGYNGIVFTAGASLTVTDCVLQNFFWNGSSNATGNGILMVPTSGSSNFVITNTTASNNGNTGISYLPPSGSPSSGVIIDHVTANANGFGFRLDTTSTSGGSTVAAISNSIVSNNSTVGITAHNGPGPLKLSVDNVNVGANQNGISGNGTADVLLGRSVVTGSGANGVINNTAPNTFYTYQNNQIDLNGTDIVGTLNTTKVLR